jgi:hypothetical protein
MYIYIYLLVKYIRENKKTQSFFLIFLFSSKKANFIFRVQNIFKKKKNLNKKTSILICFSSFLLK